MRNGGSLEDHFKRITTLALLVPEILAVNVELGTWNFPRFLPVIIPNHENGGILSRICPKIVKDCATYCGYWVMESYEK